MAAALQACHPGQLIQLVLLPDLLNRRLDVKETEVHRKTFFIYEAWLSLVKGVVKYGMMRWISPGKRSGGYLASMEAFL